MSSVDQILIFLTALFGDDLGGKYLLVWTNPGKRSAWFDNIRDAAAYAAAQQGVNVYFGICLSPEDMGTDRRCPVSSVAAMPGLWADIDIADATAHAKSNLPATVAEAKELLASLPLPPTLVVHSGNGLHAYWLFKEPWDIDNDVERSEAAALSRGWNETVMAHAKRRGWVVDMTFDLARVFRLPGTSNVKDPTNPKPVTILEHFDERRYNPEDFPEYFPEDMSAYAVEMERDRRHLDVRLSRNPVVNMAQMESSFDVEPRFKATWMKKRKDFPDQSLSSYDMSLAAYAVQCGWTDQQIADLIVAFRLKHGTEKDIKKAFRLDYITITINNARRKFGRSEADIAADAIMQDVNSRLIEQALDAPDPQDPDQPQEDIAVPEGKQDDTREGVKSVQESTKDKKTGIVPSGDKKSLLEAISAKLGVPVTRVVKYKSEPPCFAIVLGKKEIKLGKVDNMIRLGRFQTALAEGVGILLPSKIKGWDQVAQAMLHACDLVEVGEDSTARGRVKDWIESYFSTEKLSLDWEDQCKAKKPFVDPEGRVCLFLGRLRSHLAQHGDRLEKSEIATELRRFGGQSFAHPITIEGKDTTRNVFIIPRDMVLYDQIPTPTAADKPIAV